MISAINSARLQLATLQSSLMNQPQQHPDVCIHIYICNIDACVCMYTYTYIYTHMHLDIIDYTHTLPSMYIYIYIILYILTYTRYGCDTCGDIKWYWSWVSSVLVSICVACKNNMFSLFVEPYCCQFRRRCAASMSFKEALFLSCFQDVQFSGQRRRILSRPRPSPKGERSY